MFKIFATLRGQEQTSRAEALRQYAEILARADDPRKGDEARLKALLEALGITVADAELDAGAIAEMKAVEAKLVDAETLAGLREKSETASQAHAREKTAWEKREAELETAAWEASAKVRSAEMNADEALQVRQRLLLARPHAFGVEAPIPKPAWKPDGVYEYAAVRAPGSEPKHDDGPVPASVLAEAQRRGMVAVDNGNGTWNFAARPAATPTPQAAKT